MMMTKKARRASAKARKNPGGDYASLLREGERAFLSGAGLDGNPYASGSEEADIWEDGYREAQEIYPAPSISRRPTTAAPAPAAEVSQ